MEGLKQKSITNAENGLRYSENTKEVSKKTKNSSQYLTARHGS